MTRGSARCLALLLVPLLPSLGCDALTVHSVRSARPLGSLIDGISLELTSDFQARDYSFRLQPRIDLTD